MSESNRSPKHMDVARVASLGVVALLAIELLWEMVLAPIRPGGSWLVLKAVPLALVLPGVLRGHRRALQVLSLMLPFYLAEAVVRAWSETGRHALVAGFAALLAAATFGALLVWVRREREASR